jgi:hypothetical protein
MFRSIAFGLLALALCAGAPASAAEDPTFRIEFKDGAVSPREIEVPANTRIRLELVNAGESPAEFESLELKKEKVLAPKTSSVLVIRTLAPGRYDFFDDFHPGQPPATLIAK